MTDYPVVIASSEPSDRQALRGMLAERGLKAVCFSTVKETRDSLAGNNVSIVFCEQRLSDGSYRDLLTAAKQSKPQAFVIVTSHTNDSEVCREAMRMGAFAVLASPCAPGDVEWVVIRALREWRQRQKQAQAA
jgi:DNA-binding NtrC family response regulator